MPESKINTNADQIAITSCQILSTPKCDYILTTAHNGAITIISLNDNTIHCTVQAHSKSITALSVYNNIFATCSEDSYISVWKLHTDGTVIHITTHTPMSGLLTGIQYMNENMIVVTCYDSRYLYIVQIPESQ